MTDAEGDDEGEFLADEETVRVRAGGGPMRGKADCSKTTPWEWTVWPSASRSS